MCVMLVGDGEGDAMCVVLDDVCMFWASHVCCWPPPALNDPSIYIRMPAACRCMYVHISLSESVSESVSSMMMGRGCCCCLSFNIYLGAPTAFCEKTTTVRQSGNPYVDVDVCDWLTHSNGNIIKFSLTMKMSKLFAFPR